MRFHLASGRALPILLISVAQLTDADSELPDGKGKEAVENTCTVCHTAHRIRDQHRDEEGWSAILREMMEKGAAVNPDDMSVIVSYLAKNFGPDSDKKVNVNKAAAERIAAVLQLTASESDAIVKYRTKNGEFKNLNDVEKVAGLADKLAAKKEMIEF